MSSPTEMSGSSTPHAAGDEFAAAVGDADFEEPCGDGCADAGMVERESLPVVLDFVDRVGAVFPLTALDHRRVVVGDDLFERFVEEADDAVLGHVARLDVPGRLGDGLLGEIVFE